MLQTAQSSCGVFLKSTAWLTRRSKKQLKVLGIGWDLEKDEVFLNVPKSFPEATTKRYVVQGLLKVYDPLGFVCPVIIRSRLLMQKLCQGKANKWNDPLSEGMVSEYRQIIVEYEEFRSLRWPRFFGHGISDEDRLMCFCDASQKAYATVIYVQHPVAAGCFTSRILFAKARVSPVKTKMTIPRLELMALLIGVRAIKFIREKMEFTGRVVVWSDSQCVLKWIASNRVLGTFVENRLREIRKVPKLEYKFVPTADNPADLPSRGIGVKELNQFWWQGPDWSRKAEESWPNIEVELHESAGFAFLERPLEEDVVLAATVAAEAPFGIECTRFSSYGSLLRVTALCNRFVERIRSQGVPQKHQVGLEELRHAEMLWLQYLQQVSFPDLLKAIRTGKPHATKNKLGTKLDDAGVLRCHGRMGALEASQDRKFPILLRKEHHLTGLIVDHTHKICLHGGKKITLNTLRRRYWIIRGMSKVSNILSKCTKCRKADGVGLARPEMPNLPWYRVNRNFPFDYTGVDYFGPLFVKCESRSVGSPWETKKVWVCLYTCLTTRAMHLEVVSSLTANDFLLALRRFVARRGKPTKVLCDNGSQFAHVAKNDLLSNSMEGEPIDWTFITPLSPWKGGIYERMVGLVKKSLKRSIGKALLTKDQLSTLLTEVEFSLNSRPLTGSADEVSLSLSPNDLIGVRNLGDVRQVWRKEDDPSYFLGDVPTHETNPRSILANMEH